MNGELSVMGREGDTKIIWNSENDEEVANAKKSFTDLLAKGFSAFKVKKDGSKGVQIREFDLESERIILVPQMAGG